MPIEDQLRELVLKTAKQFDKFASTERTISSDDDGTLHGDFLDQIIAKQQSDRDALWEELTMLETQCHRANHDQVLADPLTKDQQRLAALVYESQELSKEAQVQENCLEALPEAPHEVVAEIQFRKHLVDMIQQLRVMLSFMHDQVNTAMADKKYQAQILTETENVHDALLERLNSIQEGNVPKIPVKMRQDLNDTRLKYQRLMDCLIDFLDEHFPPHLVDGADLDQPEEDSFCELKYILEDLMNRAVMNPNNPYVQLEPGTFWTPYIETLIKAGVAERNPKDPLSLALVDFRLYNT
ncbi:centromere-associated protein K-domain-containing protein [Gongronella butleri]|nr:centromere-associated protein K-domain-containing protein [Gongronella butleri]